MVKRMLILVIGAILWLGSTSTRAQDIHWTAWLWNQGTGTLTQVAQNGAVLESVPLPTIQGFDSYSFNAAISRHGTRVAYGVTNSATFQQDLLVYNLVNNPGLTANITLPRIIADSIGFSPTSLAFNETDTALAYGYSLEAGGWQLGVLDLTGGTPLIPLSSSDAVVKAAGVGSDTGWTPIVQKYQNGEVTFVMGVSGAEGQPVHQSYIWNTALNTIRSDIAYPTFINDTLPLTGEVVMPLLDERLPNQLNSLPIPAQQNTLQVFDPTINARYPFYADVRLTINSAHFIQGGQRILMNALNLSDTTSADPRFWEVVERDGTVSGSVAIPPDADSVVGTADGFAYILATGAASQLVTINTQVDLNSSTIVWEAAPGERPKIAWLSDDRMDNIAEFAVRPWARLADPIYAAGTVSPSQIASPTLIVSGILTVGGYATVNTTEGDELNVRSGPGTNFAIVAKVPSGTRVLLLEGPRQADALVWWRIRTPSGEEGWTVESVDDNGTKLKTLVPS